MIWARKREVRTVGELLSDAAAARPNDPYLLWGDREWSFGAVDAKARSVAAALVERGVGRRDRIVTVLPNTPEFLFTFLGASLVGAPIVPVNPAATRRELADALREAAPALIVCGDGRVRDLADAGGGAMAVVGASDLEGDGSVALPTSDVPNDDIAVMFLTSGTTGAPKLVMQTHRALVLAAEGFPWWLGLDASDRLMTPLPLWHINALAYSALGGLATGASFVLLERFSASNFWAQARAYDATQFNVVGAMLEMLGRRPPGRDDLNPARLCYTALAPATRERHVELERRFDLRIMAGYGLSESPYGTIWPLDGPPPYGSMGYLKQHPTRGEINKARVVDDAGKEVEAGGAGELWLQNPAVMAGYFGRPDESDAALADGWLRTGDLVRKGDDNAYYFVARKKEVIRRRGENIAPGELEGVLSDHPGVAEAAVIGVPSDLGEEDVKAFVVATPGAGPSPAELREWLEQRVVKFKLPRYIELVDELPHTPTGRVARGALTADRSASETDFG